MHLFQITWKKLMIITNPISSTWCGGFESHKELQTHQKTKFGVICSTALNEIWTHYHKEVGSSY